MGYFFEIAKRLCVEVTNRYSSYLSFVSGVIIQITFKRKTPEFLFSGVSKLN